MRCLRHCLLFIAVAGGALVHGQESQAAGNPAQPSTEKTAESRIKPYEKVIPQTAVSRSGVFTVHRVGPKVYYEIPTAELDREFLWVVQVARTTLGVGFGGQALGSHVVRWERKDDRVLLRSVSYEIVADAGTAIRRAVSASNNDTIVMSFPIEALGKGDAPVIDVTRLLATEVAEFSPRKLLRARGFDASRSFVEQVLAFPRNIEMRATHTYTSPVDASPGPEASPRPSPSDISVRTGMRPGSASVVMHYSMVKLPEKPMMPRLFDERVGYFNLRQLDYGRPENRAERRTYIKRWRLEKKDPQAAVSEPVQPIVYYVDPATPPKWIPYIKRGVERWQEAFEEAGFRNAIVCRDAPADPEWHPEDARYSVIRWVPSTVENAQGPHVADPRTGEILEADIKIYHNVLNLLQHWYFTQVAPLDPRARRLPFSDELMGRLLEYVVTHEVGHTLGLPHNMKASSLYPLEKVRDREWVKTMSHTPTLMDYSRFNYVAQPEDNIPPEDLIPKIGPYDKFAIRWGYTPVAGAQSADEEKPVLDGWILQAQEQTPWLRFSTAKANGSDPGENTEAVGDADAIAATALGLKNLRRVMDMLLEAVPQQGKPYDDLEEAYGRVITQWVREMNHVAVLVGGFESRQKHGGQDGVLFTPVARARQAEAVRFLNANAFATPSWLLRADILRRIEPAGAMTRLLNAQKSVLARLLDAQRMARLSEQEAVDGAAAYRMTQFLADLRAGIFSELPAAEPRVDPYRRNLQRLYVQTISDRLNGRQAPLDDQRPMLRGELRAIRAAAVSALSRARDGATRHHLEDLRDQVDRALDPRFAPAAAPATAPAGPSALREPGCWEDVLR